jgi:hypothetical protein
MPKDKNPVTEVKKESSDHPLDPAETRLAKVKQVARRVAASVASAGDRMAGARGEIKRRIDQTHIIHENRDILVAFMVFHVFMTVVATVMGRGGVGDIVSMLAPVVVMASLSLGPRLAKLSRRAEAALADKRASEQEQKESID